MTTNEPSEAAKQYMRDLIARDYAWAELDGEGLPEPIIEFSYHSLMEAFDAGREAAESRARLEGAEIAREAAAKCIAELGRAADVPDNFNEGTSAAYETVAALDLSAILAEQGRVEAIDAEPPVG